MSKENRIGAMWKPQSENPNAPFAKGNIELNGKKVNVVIWFNKWKQPGERSPDYYIELDERDHGQEPPRHALPEGTSARREQASKDRAEGVGSKPSGDGFTDDIPF